MTALKGDAIAIDGILRQARRLALLPNAEQRLAALDRIAAILERAVERQRKANARLVEQARRKGYQDGLWEAWPR